MPKGKYGVIPVIHWYYLEFGTSLRLVPWTQESFVKAQWFPSALEQLSPMDGFRVIKGCFLGLAVFSGVWASKRICGTCFSFQDVFY